MANIRKRYYSSGIRPILRALVNIKNIEDANVGNKLFKVIAPKAKSLEELPSSSKEEPPGVQNLPMVVKAEMERRIPKPPKKKEPLPPVGSWKARTAWACMKDCGACCHLEKGPQYPPVEEVLKDPKEAAVRIFPCRIILMIFILSDCHH